jgi:hypothetical protein
LVWVDDTDTIFTDGTSLSLARWRRAVTQLTQFAYIEQLQPKRGKFPPGTTQHDVTDLGYQVSDAAEAATPIHISAKVVGEPGEQRLEIVASKPITNRLPPLNGNVHRFSRSGADWRTIIRSV